MKSPKKKFKQSLCQSLDDDQQNDSDLFDSRQEAIKLFKKIISPTKNKDFFR
jgi:hypothetical protein